MIVHDCEQGTPEWLAARLGIPTASEFDKIITPTGKPSTQCDAYAHRLLAEIMVGKPVESFEPTAWMDRGNVLEPEAVSFYELQTDFEAVPVGFVTDDLRTMGASPDRLIGDAGLLEIKCPAPHTHVQYLLDGCIDRKYYPQVQGQLLVTGRAWADLVSYHPELPPVVIRIERDLPFLATLTDLLTQFTRGLEAKRRVMVERGYLAAA